MTLNASGPHTVDTEKSRRTPLVLASMLGILLTLPSLWVGFAQDDYIFLTIFRGAPDMPVLEQSIWDTYTFSEGDVERNRERMERGILPWWAVPEWKVDMWRPLPSLSHWLDFQIFGENPLPMHAHSVLLYGVVCLAVGWLYKRLLGRAAFLAAFLFAVDSAHGVAVGWLSNRHALYVALFGALALGFHHHWRQQATPSHPFRQWLRHGLPALVFLAAALFSGEAAVGLGGFFFAYALFLDPLSRPAEDGTENARRARGATSAVLALLPYLGVVVVWRLLYNALGHGTFGSWLYTDPLREPLAFLQNLPVYYALNLLGLFGLPDSTLWVGVPSAFQLPVLCLVVAYLLFVAWCLAGVIRARAEARFLALGTLLALAPPCATLPADRNLMLSSIGAMGLIAVALRWYLNLPQEQRKIKRLRAFAMISGAVHLIASPLLLPGASYAIDHMDRGFRFATDSAVPAEPAPGMHYVALNTPADLLGASLPIFRAGRGLPQPHRWWWLCAAPNPVSVERTGEKQLLLRPEGGFLQQPFGQTFRWPGGYPMAVGNEVHLDGMHVQVTEASDDGQPLAVQFNFDAPLDDPKFHWLTWSEDAYVPLELPPIGASIEVPGLDLGVIWARLLKAVGSPGAGKE